MVHHLYAWGVAGVAALACCVCIHAERMCVVVHACCMCTRWVCSMQVCVCGLIHMSGLHPPPQTLPWHPASHTRRCVFMLRVLAPDRGLGRVKAFLMPQLSAHPEEPADAVGMALTVLGDSPLASVLCHHHYSLSTNPALGFRTDNKVGFLNPWQTWRWGCPSTSV